MQQVQNSRAAGIKIQNPSRQVTKLSKGMRDFQIMAEFNRYVGPTKMGLAALIMNVKVVMANTLILLANEKLIYLFLTTIFKNFKPVPVVFRS